jgi:hypothetical protein
VADCVQFSNGILQWNISFTKLVHDWEVDLAASFFDLLYSLRLGQGCKDKICRIPSNRRMLEGRYFFMRFARSLVLHSLEEHLEI